MLDRMESFAPSFMASFVHAKIALVSTKWDANATPDTIIVLITMG